MSPPPTRLNFARKRLRGEYCAVATRNAVLLERDRELESLDELVEGALAGDAVLALLLATRQTTVNYMPVP